MTTIPSLAYLTHMLKLFWVHNEEQLTSSSPRVRNTPSTFYQKSQISLTAYVFILKDINPIRINTYRQGYAYPQQNQHLHETYGVGVADYCCPKIGLLTRAITIKTTIPTRKNSLR